MVQAAAKVLERLRRHPRLAEAALVLGLVVVSVAVLRQPALGQRFTVDESRWIATSRYFWTTFVERDLFGPAWQPNYLVLTQPPVARYLIGFGLWLQGWSPDQLNGRYDSLRGYAFNEEAGNVPGPELLAAARRTVFVFAVGAVLLLYLVGRSVGGPLAGLLAAALALANPLLSTLWTRALAEAPLAFFSLLALLLALTSLGRARPGGARRGSGVALGLAAATKLSGVLGGLGLALFALLEQGFGWWRARHFEARRSWLVLGLGGLVVFVVANPLLYPDPIGRSLGMFDHRREEMLQQQLIWPSQAVRDDLVSRMWLIGRRVFRDYGSLPGRGWLPLDASLAVIGLGIALLATWRDVVARRRLGPPAMLLCWSLAVYGGVAATLGFDSSHYYAPLVAANVLLEAVALAALAQWVASRSQYTQAPETNIGSRMAQTSIAAATPTHGSGPRAARSSGVVVQAKPPA